MNYQREWNKAMGFWQWSCGCIEFQDGWQRCVQHAAQRPVEGPKMNTDPRKSAQPCGCDEGAGYYCSFHAQNNIDVPKTQNTSREIQGGVVGMPSQPVAAWSHEMTPVLGEVASRFMAVLITEHTQRYHGTEKLGGMLPVLAEQAVSAALALAEALQRRRVGGQDA